ncbi:hypothetical protein T11_12309 [Trichinella zimbabwensis]|uniref:Uncharacterized protein n=1 Tax=Trichinella zimbabwensis TaxID=268475 RepID=A0A0V1HC40_9BILA|nr:hypothetical protein T11_12309 [Trichinella zimbabwensis]
MHSQIFKWYLGSNHKLGFEKLFIILRTLIIRKTIQCTASHHTFTQQNSVNIIKSDAEHKRNSHDMKLNTSYP